MKIAKIKQLVLQMIKRYKVVFYVIIIILAIGGIFYYEISRVNNNKAQNKLACFRFRDSAFGGKVTSAFYNDNKDVKAFVITFADGQKFANPFFLKSLNGSIKEGDSLEKVPGSFKFIIYRRDSVETLVIEQDIDCEMLK